MKNTVFSLLLSILGFWGASQAAEPPATLLVEAEHFSHPGGWQLDTQFVDIMGSPYLIAHGLGQPVANATTDIEIPVAATYHPWVRT